MTIFQIIIKNPPENKYWHMRVLVPVLSQKDNSDSFVRAAVKGASVVHLLLVLDSNSMHANFGFKASEIMNGRQTVESIKKGIKANKKLCNDIIEWGNTIEKIAQIAEMKQVGKIVVHNAEKNPHFNQVQMAIQQHTQIPVEVI